MKYLVKQEVAEKYVVQNSKIDNHIHIEVEMEGTHSKGDLSCFGRKIEETQVIQLPPLFFYHK